jgi:alkylation response protein AidB-like acyl-CoA dehydrogenase
MLADMAMKIEAAKALIYKTAWLMDNKLADNNELSKLASMAKCFASDMAMEVTINAIQVLGGYGYMKDYPVERMMRDAKLWQIGDGTNQVQRIVIAHHILSD